MSSQSSSARHLQLNSARVETLEQRRLMSAVTHIDDYDIQGDSNVQVNGSANNYIGNLQLPAGTNSVGSAFYGTKVPISRFNTTVTLGPTNSSASSEFTDFVIQNGANTDMGGVATADAAYGSGTFSTNSVAVVINQVGDGTTASMAFASGGIAPTTFIPMTGINLTQSGLFTMNIHYNNGKLRFTLVDQSDPTHIFSTAEKIDLPTVLGGQSAYVGFAGSMGDPNTNGTEESFLRQWDYVGLESPSFSTPAATLMNRAGTRALASAVATMSDSSGTTYQWTTVSRPSGYGKPRFDDSTSASTGVRFKAAGHYELRVTATSSDGTTTSSDVAFEVNPVIRTLAITPHARRITVGKDVQFKAAVVDQFNHRLADQPDFTFAVTKGPGTIDADGVYTSDTTGHVIVTATGAGLTGFAGETIIDAIEEA